MFRNVLAVILIMFSLGINVVFASPDTFVSMSVYQDAIDYLDLKEVIGNPEAFRPNEEIPRAEFLALVLKNVGYNPANLKRKIFNTPYQDVTLNDKYAPYIYEAFEKGLFPKTDKFYPKRTITRIEALRIFFAVEGIPASYYKANLRKYKDIPELSPIAPIVGTALDFELILPVSQDFFGIMHKITKGEVAEMMYQYDLYHGEVSLNSTSPYLQLEEIPQMDLFLDIWQRIHNNYVFSDQIDDEKVMYSAIEGMVNALGDPFSIFMPPVESADFNDNLEGELEGIGAYINYKDGKVIIVAPIQASPAEKAGLKPNDEIIKIDNEEIENLNLSEVVHKIKGPKGTTVQITILREGQEKIFTITRDKIKLKSVNLEVKNQIATIAISQFLSKTNFEFSEISQELLNQNVKGIILDLRNNPGGYLNTAINILGYFVEAGKKIVTIDYPSIIYPQKANGDAELKDLPLVILINQGSASASEIVAGALQDLGLATVVGETSYGKGTVQEVTFYQDGSNLKLTVAKWLTPNGRWINKKGIVPDIEIENVDNTLKDEQMEKALEILNSKF